MSFLPAFSPYPHQQAAISDLRSYFVSHKTHGNPAIVLPTGAGKSLVIAEVAKAIAVAGKRCLVLHSQKELVEQNSAAFEQQTQGKIPYGINIASLGRRDTEEPVIFCGIHSVAGKALEFGEVPFILVDECHLISPKEDSRYQRFFEQLRIANPHFRAIGLTATPYRLGTGEIFGPDTSTFFDHVCHTTSIPYLLEKGFLSPVVNAGVKAVSMQGIRKTGGDFNQKAMSDRFASHVISATKQTIQVANDEGRKHCLIFCASVDNANAVADLITEETGEDARVVCGETTALERDAAIRDFKSGELRWLVNVNVLTTGFNAPHIDLISAMRATCSPGLWYQMVGRGFRTASGKENCLLLDWGGNLARHGELDSPMYGVRSGKQGQGTPPTKVCPNCSNPVPASAKQCRFCPHEFEMESSPTHQDTADSSARVLASQEAVLPTLLIQPEERHPSLHKKRDWEKGDPMMVKVRYMYTINDGNVTRFQDTYLCPEHGGYARKKFVEWFKRRSLASPPETAVELLALFDAKAIAEDMTVGFTKKNQAEKFWQRNERITTVGPLPDFDGLDFDELYA